MNNVWENSYTCEDCGAAITNGHNYCVMCGKYQDLKKIKRELNLIRTEINLLRIPWQKRGTPEGEKSLILNRTMDLIDEEAELQKRYGCKCKIEIDYFLRSCPIHGIVQELGG